MQQNNQICPKEMDIVIGEKNRVVNCTIWNNQAGKRVLVIAPAMGVSRRFYKTIATYFFELSYSVISFDYYGMMNKKSKEDPTIRLSDWGFKDINAVIGYARERFPKQELYFLGHSIAGQLFPLAKMSNEIKAAYLVASQNVSKNNWSGFSKFKVNIFWHIIIPFCTNLFGYLPAAAYGGRHNLHKSIAMDWADWGKNKLGVLGRVPKAPARYKNLNVPTKFLGFSDDDMLAPLKSVEHLYESYGTPFKHYEHACPKQYGMTSIGHFKFFKKECKFLWPKVDSWFNHVRNY